MEYTLAYRFGMFLFSNELIFMVCVCREETEIIEGEVVEIQIDRPATGTVSSDSAPISTLSFSALSLCSVSLCLV